MSKKRFHLVCNAHLDPVWLWHWEDGLTEALSTYRVAADFCDRYPNFVFNHNEVLLYRWAQEYEPQLFKRIQQHVEAGRWEISGGAYIQPDVNNASGESHIRQFLLGRAYFEEHFNRYPRTAYNFDPFGHGEGFPQILAGCGMERYVFCRPDYGTYELPVGPFRWRDRSGHCVIARRSDDHYLTNGNFVGRAQTHLPHFDSEPVSMILWGIGNHGGGPSHEEYAQIKAYAKAHPEYEFVDSTIDAFFDDCLQHLPSLPEVQGEIQNSFPGCYTSMARVKRAHREAESLMASTERLAALAWWWDTSPYPAKELEIAWRDILFAEFHDILPGSGVPSVEQDSIQMLSHAKEIMRRQRMRSLHSLISCDPDGADLETPVFVANPHGFRVKEQVEFELQVNNNAWAISKPEIRLRHKGRDVVCQRLRAEASCAGDWRVRLAAEVDLAPWEILRFDEYYVNDKGRTPRMPAVSPRTLSFKTKSFDLKINPKTGLIQHLSLPGSRKSLVGANAFGPAYWADLDHSWTSGSPKQAKSHSVGSVSPPWDRAPSESFRLASADEAARLSPPPADKWLGSGKRTVARPIHIIEHGPLRTVVEAMLVCGSSAVIRQYVIGHGEGSLEIRDRVFNNHRDVMLKLMVPLSFEVAGSSSETLYAAAERDPDKRHEEHTNQRWVAVKGAQAKTPVHLAVVNTGSFGHSLTDDELGVNVLRAPAYSSFNLDPNDESLNQRFLPRQDQGEHEVSYRIIVGKRFSETRISRAAQAFNTPPVWQVYYPQPDRVDRRRRGAVTDTVRVDDAQVQVVALKKSQKGNALIVRLQNTSSQSRDVSVQVKPHRQKMRLTIGAYGLATISVNKGGKSLRWREVDLVERPVRKAAHKGK